MSNLPSYQQSYGTYQQPYPIVYAAGAGVTPQMLQSAATAHYSPRFPPPPAAPGYQFNVQPPGQSIVAVAETIPSISPEIASKEVQRLILAQLKTSEYDSIEPPALKRLEIEVVVCTWPLIYFTSRAHLSENSCSKTI
jgi:transcription initiation factor TFIID subunit 8